MARRSSNKPETPAQETLEERVAFLQGHFGKTCPVDMLFKTEEEVAQAKAYLAKRKIKNIGAKMDTRKKR